MACEDPTSFDVVFPADRPHPTLCHCMSSSAGSSEFPAFSQIYLGSVDAELTSLTGDRERCV